MDKRWQRALQLGVSYFTMLGIVLAQPRTKAVGWQGYLVLVAFGAFVVWLSVGRREASSEESAGQKLAYRLGKLFARLFRLAR